MLPYKQPRKSSSLNVDRNRWSDSSVHDKVQTLEEC